MTESSPSSSAAAAPPRRQTMQEYMRAYASGEVGARRERFPDEAAKMQDAGALPVRQSRNQQAQQPPTRPQPLSPTSPEALAYAAFLTQAAHRRLQRHDLATREKIWAESEARARARLAAVSAEKVALEGKLARMAGERERYKRENVVEVGEVEDEREGRRWEEWLAVERGVGGGGEAGEEGEGEGGVEI